MSDEERRLETNAYAREWRKKNPERATAIQRAWSRQNKDKLSAKYRRVKTERPDLWLTYSLRTKYGITYDDYLRLSAEQGDVCAICKSKSGDGHRLAVDHCHETGIVRGLLCKLCNMALGLMGDDGDRLRAAAEYLERAKSGSRRTA